MDPLKKIQPYVDIPLSIRGQYIALILISVAMAALSGEGRQMPSDGV